MTQSDPCDLLNDDGVLVNRRSLILGSLHQRLTLTAETTAVDPWKQHHPPTSHRLRVISEIPPSSTWPQVVVIVERHRAVLQQHIEAALLALQPNGRLVLVGGNDTGIRSAIKQCAQLLKEPGEQLANRARARVHMWEIARPRDMSSTGPTAVTLPWSLQSGQEVKLSSPPGTFAAGKLDAGSAMLIDHLTVLRNPARLWDIAAGIGVLSFAALQQWPDIQVEMYEADARAVLAAHVNAQRLGVDAHVQAHWWAAGEALPQGSQADTMVMNPPFHQGKQVDLSVPQRLFQIIPPLIARGDRR